MDLSKKKNHELLEELKDLTGQERLLVTRVLLYLQEVEKRKLFLEEGYSSLFAFCTEFLLYTPAEAQVRIEAMRLGKEIPEVIEKIKEGKVSLSNAAEAQGHFRREEKKRVVPKAEKEEVLESLYDCTTREAEKKLNDRYDPEAKVKLSFYASPELLEKLEKCKGLLAHQNYEGDLAKLIEILADKALKVDDAPPRSAPQAQETQENRTRYIPKATQDFVWKRANHQCEYEKNGKRCTSRHALEIDHIVEYAKRGSNKPENLRLLCSAHNKFRNFQQSG